MPIPPTDSRFPAARNRSTDIGVGRSGGVAESLLLPLRKFLQARDSLSLQERYGGRAKSLSLWYHGTDRANLRSILSQGLIPDPKKRVWGDDTHASWRAASKASLNGIYITQNLMTATGAVRTQRGEDERLVVVLQVSSRSVVHDEDTLRFRLRLDSVYDNPYSLLAAYVQKRIGDWDALADTLVQKAMDGIEAEKKLHPKMAEAVRASLRAAYAAAVERQVAHFAVSHRREFMPMLYNALSHADGVQDADQHLTVGSDGEWKLLDDGLKPVMDTRAAEKSWRDAIGALTRTTRSVDFDNYSKTARAESRIGFTGDNRIVCIFGERTIQNAEGKHLTQLIRYYGDIPAETLEQVRQRFGAYEVVSGTPIADTYKGR